MSLKKQIEQAMKEALLLRRKEDLSTLRGIKSMILLAETKGGKKQSLDKGEEIALLMKAAKQRRESGKIFKEKGRDELYRKEMAELEIINRYLPDQLSEEEIEEKLKQIIISQKASTIQDLGKVMGMATKELSGRANNKTLSDMAKRLLDS